jgi:osmotically-inducible protein OsmY
LVQPAPPEANEIFNMKTDKQLQQDVMDELSWEPSVNAQHIGVEVSDGVVTLAGHVGSYTEKFNAERATQRVAGVKALAVEMDVKLSGTMTKRTDADIAQSVARDSAWSSPGVRNVVDKMTVSYY